MNELTWVKISKEALKNNIKKFRQIVKESRRNGTEDLPRGTSCLKENKILCPCVKANAYGHGLIECSNIFLEAGADWLGVNSLYEAEALRKSGITSPIYILGYVPKSLLKDAVNLDVRLVVYNKETVDALAEAAKSLNKPVKIHLKAETGNNRQGLLTDDLIDFAKYIKNLDGIEIEGLSTHFANIEDTTDHSFAELQLNRFNEAYEKLKGIGIDVPIRHCANSAATLLFDKTHFEMVRPGISCYGMWPSNETYISYIKEFGKDFELTPAFTWKTKIAQIKTVPKEQYIGYGCAFKTSHDTKIAVLPVGYYDGYDRGVSGAYVLIHGKRAYIRGRVCMNIIMVEITDIPEAKLEDEVILIGRDKNEFISAEKFADFANTINYEVTTRVNDRIPRIYA